MIIINFIMTVISDIIAEIQIRIDYVFEDGKNFKRYI